MKYRTTTRDTVSKNTNTKSIATRNTNTKSVATRNTNTKSSNARTATKNIVSRPSSNRTKGTVIRNKRRISSSQRNIKRPIPHKTRSPKVNRNVIKQAMKPKQMDYAIFFTVLMLVIFGIVMVFSASYYYAMNHAVFDDKYYFVTRQGSWAVIGLAAMMFMTFFDYRKIKKYSVPAYIISNILLVLVLLFGMVANDSKRWLMGFQPSELAKLSIIIFLSYIIDKNPKMITTWNGFLKCMVFIGLTSLLIASQNLSTGIVVASIGCIIIFVAGTKITYFLPMLIPAGIAGAALVLIEDFRYRLDRITIWLDPFSDPTDKGFQIIQSMYAIASGGLFGKGLGNSMQKLGFVPEPYNDIIFSIICEELGLVGAGALIILFIILISRGIRVALRAKDLFASLVATGITSMVAVQAIINISVATNTIPNTGMALPFISYGGTSLCMLMASMGILLNISCYTK